jgi:chromosome segregation ATPase
MDWVTLISAIGGGGLISGVFQWLGTRKLNKADYAERIIEQCDKRVAQYEKDYEQMRGDRDSLISERNAAQEEAKIQRKCKQEWRSKYEESVSRIHELEMTLRDAQHNKVIGDWFRCEVNGCAKRIPPRKQENEQKNKKDNGNITEGTPEQQSGKHPDQSGEMAWGDTAVAG